jgi:hypothetical protein
LGESLSRPRSPLPRTVVSTSPDLISGKEDNPKVGLSQSLQGTRVFNVHNYPHTELQVNRSNKIAILSNFTNYNDTSSHCSLTPSANSRWDIQYDKSAGWPSGANSASPEVDLSLGANSASLKPGIGYLLAANPTGGHSFDYGTHIFKSWSGLGRDLE